MAKSKDRPVSWWQTLISLIVLGALCLGFVALFSDMVSVPADVARQVAAELERAVGVTWATDALQVYERPHISIGALIHRMLPVRYELARTTVYGTVALALLLYTLDIVYWRGPCGLPLKVLVGLASLCLVVVGAVLVLPLYPQYPLAVYVLVMAAASALLRRCLFSRSATGDVARTLGKQYVLLSVAMLGTWLSWVWAGVPGEAADNFLTVANQARWAYQMGCDSSVAHGTRAGADGSALCLGAVLLWGSPLFLGASLAVAGVAMALLGSALQAPSATASASGKVLVACLGLFATGIYVASRIAFAGMAVSYTITAISLAAMAATTVAYVCVGSLGELLGAFPLDWGRGLVVFAGLPLLLALIPLVLVKQTVRRVCNCCGFRCVKPLGPKEDRLLLTQAASSTITQMRSWPWARVLYSTNVIALGLGWGLVYSTLVFYMLLSSLAGLLEGMDWVVSVVGLYTLGVCLHLIPTVPSPAVHFTCAMLLVPVCEAQWSALGWSEGILWPCVLASIQCFCMKLSAHAMQQKLLGEWLCAGARLRSKAAVNSRAMKALRHILSQPGLSLAKCALLCGGPDWPVAVLCGMLRLSSCQMLIGLAPVALTTTATALAAAFAREAEEGSPWGDVSNLLLVFVGVANVLQVVYAAYKIDETIRTSAAELDAAYEEDAEVAKLEKLEADNSIAYAAVTQMANVPFLLKLMLWTATAANMACAYLFYLMPEILFEPFNLGEDVSEVACTGCPRAHIKQWGLYSYATLVYGVLAMVLFSRWSRAAARSYIHQPASVEEGKANADADVNAAGEVTFEMYEDRVANPPERGAGAGADDEGGAEASGDSRQKGAAKEEEEGEPLKPPSLQEQLVKHLQNMQKQQAALQERLAQLQQGDEKAHAEWARRQRVHPEQLMPTGTTPAGVSADAAADAADAAAGGKVAPLPPKPLPPLPSISDIRHHQLQERELVGLLETQRHFIGELQTIVSQMQAQGLAPPTLEQALALGLQAVVSADGTIQYAPTQFALHSLVAQRPPRQGLPMPACAAQAAHDASSNPSSRRGGGGAPLALPPPSAARGGALAPENGGGGFARHSPGGLPPSFGTAPPPPLPAERGRAPVPIKVEEVLHPGQVVYLDGKAYMTVAYKM